MNSSEYARRASRTVAVIDLFTARPHVWIPADVLAQVGGFCAWRTRVSDARVRLETEQRGTVQWNGKVKESAYRYVPAVPVVEPAQVDLFELRA